MKKVYLKSFLVLLAITLVISCTKELINMPKDALTIEKAKAWYEMQNTTPVMMLKSSKADKKADCTPDWEKAFASNNDDFEVVEAPLTSQTKFSFYTKESLELLKVNNEQGYLNSNSRIVIQKNKKTGLREDYIMTIIGDADYLKTKKCQLTNNTYLKKDKDFSGYVLFHNSNGGFVNGWQFNKGKVIGAMTLTSSNQSSLRLKVAAPTSSSGSSTDCYMTSVYMIYDVINYVQHTSYEEWDYLYSYTVCYSSGGSGLAGGGGVGTSSTSTQSSNSGNDIIPLFTEDLCVKEIYDSLMAGSTLADATSVFLGQGAKWGNLYWNIAPNLTNDGYTQPAGDKQTVSISLSDKMLNSASGVFIATTMIHEALHAFMWNYINAHGGNVSANDWPALYEEYFKQRTDPALYNGTPQHTIIADLYRDVIKSAIAEYDKAFNITNRNPYEIEALSWAGLQKTSAWLDFSTDPNTAIWADYYKDIITRLSTTKENNDKNNCKVQNGNSTLVE